MHHAHDLAERWRADAAAGTPGLVVPDGAPRAEYARTPAAARVATLASRSGLFHFHFERRTHLPLPEAWVPPGDPSLAEPPAWADGVLPEQKYQSFRHDLAVASYHPHHRAKWAVHELCHGLVGFAWRTNATPLFHALAGRLAELLPVALWYFFDEAYLRRCPDHHGAGSLFRTLCPHCEAIAGPLADHEQAPELIRDGLAFVERELAAVARSRRLGRPIPHLWASIDLSSDGIAYAQAHGRRLASDEQQWWSERFLVAGGGWSPDLDELEARVLAVLGELCGRDAVPLAPTPSHGRWRWTLQDLGHRLATVLADTGGEARDELESILTDMVPAVRATADPHCSADAVDARAAEACAMARARYEQAAEEWELPDAREVFALGYALPGGSDGAANLEAGVRTALPLTVIAADQHMPELCRTWSAEDGMSREPAAARFARHLRVAAPALADLARWEAMVVHLPRPSDVLRGPGTGDRLAPGFVASAFEVDVLTLAERVDAGGVDLHWQDGRPTWVAHDGMDLPAGPFGVVVGRDAEGELVVVELDAAAAEHLATHPDDPGGGLDDDELRALREIGVLVPSTLAETAPDG